MIQDRYNPEQRADDERSLKYYRDLKNVTDTAFEEGSSEGFEIGFKAGRRAEKTDMARQMHLKGLDTTTIFDLTGLHPSDWE